MSIQNREAFLDKLASRLGRERRTSGVERPQWSVTPQDEVFKGMSQDELVEVLEKHCKVIHTTFKRTDRDGLSKVLNETLEAYEGKLIITSKDARYQEYGVTEFFEEQKDQLDVHVWESALGKENQKIAERADVASCSATSHLPSLAP